MQEIDANVGEHRLSEVHFPQGDAKHPENLGVMLLEFCLIFDSH
jgi:hypothetical protein